MAKGKKTSKKATAETEEKPQPTVEKVEETTAAAEPKKKKKGLKRKKGAEAAETTEATPTTTPTTTPATEEEKPAKKAKKGKKKAKKADEEAAPMEEDTKKEEAPAAPTPTPTPAASGPPVKCFWGGLPIGTTEEQAKAAFGDALQTFEGTSKAFGFVFLSPDSVDGFLASPPQLDGQQTRLEKSVAKEDKSGRTIFVGSVPAEAEESHFKTHWEGIELKDLRFSFRDGANFGVAFAEFADAATANKALAVGDLTIGSTTVRMKIDEKPAKGGAGARGGGGGGFGGGRDESGPTTTLFLGGCPQEMTDELAKAHFAPIEPVSIRWSYRPDKPLGVGFIEFDSVDAATQALSKEGFTVAGRSINMKYAAPKPPRDGGGGGGGGGFGGGGGGKFQDKEGRECHVTNMPGDVTDDQLKAALPGANFIKFAMRDGEFQGRGWIVFDTKEQAEAAAAAGSCKVPGGECTVEMSKPREPRQGGFGGGGGGGGRFGGGGRDRGRGRGRGGGRGRGPSNNMKAGATGAGVAGTGTKMTFDDSD